MMKEIVSSGARRHTDGIVRGARILKMRKTMPVDFSVKIG